MRGHRLDVAKRRLQAMPWFGVLERMAESLHLFRHALHTELVRTTPTFNLNKYNKTVSDATLKVLREHNRLDLELYDFAVQEFSARLEEAGGSIPSIRCDENVLCWDRQHASERQWDFAESEEKMQAFFDSEGEAKDHTLCAPRT
eukprot:5535690-Prorocentrum_lima.AAC.1